MSSYSHLEGGPESLSTSRPTSSTNLLHPMSLDWDTLLEIMRFLSRKSASRMSRTCHTLLRHAPRVLLAADNEWKIIRISSIEQLLSFHQFMLGGRHDAFRHLKQIQLHMQPRQRDQTQLSELLPGLFAHAEELRYLEISNSELLIISGQVIQAFTQLRKLRTLKFLNIRTSASAFQPILDASQAPLTYVSATCLSDIGVDDIDLCRLLASFKGSLRAVDFRGAIWDTFDVQYPHVYTLTAHVESFETLGSMAACFPYIQELSLSLEDEEEWSEEELDELRMSAVESQRIHMWRSLLQLCADNVTQLYLMGIRCRVYHIIIEYILRSELEGRLLTATLAEVQPSILELGLELPTYDTHALSHHLSPVASNLSQLRFGLEYPVDEGLPDTMIYTMGILDQLSELRLHTLSLGIRVRSYQDWTQVGEWIERSFDFEALAWHAMCTIPTLRVIVIQADHGRAAELRYVCMDGGNPQSSKKALFKVQPGTTAYQEFFNTSPMFVSPPSVAISTSSQWID